jgi:hypothetical protein
MNSIGPANSANSGNTSIPTSMPSLAAPDALAANLSAGARRQVADVEANFSGDRKGPAPSPFKVPGTPENGGQINEKG